MRTAQELFERAAIIMLDEGVYAERRTTLAEMARWANDGLLAIVSQKPNACSRTLTMPMEQGTLQALPEGYLKLLRPVRNIDNAHSDRTPRRIITVVPEEQLNAINIFWHDHKGARFNQQVKHVVFDLNNPKAFYVYPGNDGKGLIEVVLSKIPAPIKARGEVEELASYATALDLDDSYFNALLDFLLYRAYAKDAQNAGAANRAQLHFSLYAGAIGLQLAAEQATSPNKKAGVADAATGAAPTAGGDQ